MPVQVLKLLLPDVFTVGLFNLGGGGNSEESWNTTIRPMHI